MFTDDLKDSLRYTRGPLGYARIQSKDLEGGGAQQFFYNTYNYITYFIFNLNIL